MSKIRLALAALLLTQVAACGGGGGGDTGTGNSSITTTLLAGSGASGVGNVDGTGTTASFNAPYGIASDSAGNVFVADMLNNSIRKITPAGVVTTLAGSLAGASGNIDAVGTAARFNTPFGVAVDGTGNVFVADTYNNAIRKITPAGTVSTFASIAGPWATAADNAGNIFVSTGLAISKISSTGVVTDFAGSGGFGSADGIGAAASFIWVRGICTDNLNNIYVADTDNNTIRKITPAGVVTTLAGQAGLAGSLDGTGAAARFDQPFAVAADSAGNVFVADHNNHTIRKVTPAGVVTTLAGTAGLTGNFDGAGQAARFDHPIGIATDSTGSIYVSDYWANTIRKITPSGVVSTLAGSGGARNHIDGAGSAARFNVPVGVTTNSAGDVYVADYNSNTIRKITSAGVASTLAGSAGILGSADGTGAAASFAHPYGIAADGAGNIFVTDNGNHTVRKITLGGVVSTFAGSPGNAGNANGAGMAAMFNSPTGIAIDSAGNVFIADSLNHIIRKISSAGVVSTFAGSGAVGNADGIGVAASFVSPLGVTIDSSSNIYVSDALAIRKITPTGTVSTLATGFNNPVGIVADSGGNVYVSEAAVFGASGIVSSARIRKISPTGVTSTISTAVNDPKGLALTGRTLYTTSNNAIIKVANVP